MDAINFYLGPNQRCLEDESETQATMPNPAASQGPWVANASLSCPICPGKGHWRRMRGLVTHVTSAAHLENEVEVDQATYDHLQYEEWEQWKRDIGLSDIISQSLSQRTKHGQLLRDRYNRRRQVLQGRVQDNLTTWQTAEGLLTADFEFGPGLNPVPDIPPEATFATAGSALGGLGSCSGGVGSSSFGTPDISDFILPPEMLLPDEENAFIDSFEATLRHEMDQEAKGEGGGEFPQHHKPLASTSAEIPGPFDQPSSWFTAPHKENTVIDYHQDNPWYPFESEIFARLFVFVNCRTNPLSRQQLLRVWDLLGRFSKVPVPAFSAVINYATSIPRPRTYEMQTAESVPKSYSQISITDMIRMQLAIPETHRLLQEHSIMIHRSSPTGSKVLRGPDCPPLKVRKELWTGSKWHTTPTLQPPNTTLENSEEAWFGMILQFPSSAHMSQLAQRDSNSDQCEYGIFCGQSLLDHDQVLSHRLHYYPLQQIPEGLLFPHNELVIDQKKISYINRNLVTACFQASFPLDTTQGIKLRTAIYILTTDPTGSPQASRPSRESFDQIFNLHPVLVNRNKVSQSLPITVVNISLWQDGLSGNASKKWNPYEACLMSLAGLPREITDTVFGNHFVAVARDIKGIHLLDGVVQELNRLQRGILAWNAGMNKLAVVTGSIVQLKVDNPAASDLCNHMWKSNFPCRLCLFTTSKTTKMKVLDSGVVRDPESSIALLESLSGLGDAAAKKGENGLRTKERISPLFGVIGFDPFKDTPWEKLHSFFLGPAKEATRALLKLAPIVTRKDEMRMFIDAMSWDNINGHLAGRRVMQWSGSFVGYDYKVFLQIAPFLLAQFLTPTPEMSPSLQASYLNLHELFTHLAEFNRLIYQSHIQDLELWTKQCGQLARRIIHGFEQWQVLLESQTPTAGLGTGVGAKGKKQTQQARKQTTAAGSAQGRKRPARSTKASRPSPHIGNTIFQEDASPEHQESNSEPEMQAATESGQTLIVMAPSTSSGIGEQEDLKQARATMVVNFDRKPKFHLLTHVPYWVERFGPPRNSHTETEEHLNSVIRDRLHHSNRQGPSVDTARRFATLEGITFMSRGGIWRHPEKEIMTTAGSSFQRMMSKDELWREMGGLTLLETAEPKLRNPGKLISREINVDTLEHYPDRMLFLTIGLSTVDIWDSGRIARDIAVRIGSFVQDSEGTIYRILRIYRSLLPPAASTPDPGGQQPQHQSIKTFFTLCRFSRVEPSPLPILGCLAFQPSDDIQILHSTKLQNLLNMQHLCDSTCGIRYDSKAWMVERKAVGGRIWGHGEGGVYVLNRFGLGTV